jgi:hypothetical protein
MPVSFEKLNVGSAYSRNHLAELWGYVGTEAISRGVVTPRDDNKIILFVTLDKRPEDEQYQDELVGSVLLCEACDQRSAPQDVTSSWTDAKGSICSKRSGLTRPKDLPRDSPAKATSLLLFGG